jgi:serine/threonine-protein kinase
MNPQRPRDWSTARQRASDSPGAPGGATFAVRRYALHSEIGSGSVATVHLGRFGGDDFAHTVAIKRLRPQFAKDTELVSMLVAGARLAARVRHSNVVPILDVVAGTELLVVMEYVQGESLATLLRTLRGRDSQAPLPIVSGVFVGGLNGLQAVHGARGASPEGTGIGDQDVPPHDVLVGTDGVARLIDLGIGRAQGRTETSDLFAASVMLWEALAGRPLPPRTSPEGFDPPSRYRPELPPEIDAIVSKGLARPPAARFATASEMALALEAAVTPATQSQIGRWVESLAGPALEERARLVAEIENAASRPPADSVPDAPAHEQATATPAAAATSWPLPAPTPTPADQHRAVTRRERVRSAPAFETKRGLGPVEVGPAVETSRRRSSDDWSLPRRSRATVLAGLASAVLVAAIGARLLVVGPGDAASVALPAATQGATAHEGAAQQTTTHEVAAPAEVAPPADQPAAMPQGIVAVAPPSPVEPRPVTPRPARPRRSSKPARDEASPRTKRDDVL